MIRIEDALARILENIKPLPAERVSILDALGRVADEDIHAGRNIPPKDNSAMDGYAVRFQDILSASPEHPAILSVVEDIPAGSIPQKRVGPAEAARIMTGAPIPEGADAVIRMEDTEKEGRAVKIFVASTQGQYIRNAGEDVAEGEKVISRGNVIRPAEVGIMASLGRSFVRVYQKPLVAVLATGNELVDVDGKPTLWQIISSSSYAFSAMIAECGGIPLQIGIAKDTREDLLEKFEAAGRADVIISSGGVSVGDYDLVKDIMKEVGNDMQFWQVAMKPGKPLAFGTLKGIPLFGLPGNPVSSMVSFEQFVRPSILKMTGHKNLFRRMIKATLSEDVTKAKGLVHFIRAKVEYKNGHYIATTTGEQSSGMLKTMVLANGLVVLPEDMTAVKAGDEVTVQLLDRSLEQTMTPQFP
jgi:molybdopterin molybdotransferase